jgi:non-specific serine/threonine protein kinase
MPPHHNLPHPVSRFVGRTEELVELSRLLSENRLLTLVGPGGAGKTRLAMQTAHAAADRFPDGARWIDLAPLTDPALVPPTFARALSLSEQPGRPVAATLAESLLDRHMLLVVDNCEHLIAPAADLVERLLSTGPELSILTTSREPLGVPGEVTFTVPPLATPAPHSSISLSELETFESIQLFVARAREANPAFALTEANAEAIAALCRGLDGLPLALELAAARLRALSVDEIAARMDRRLQLLAGGRRTEPQRHQTLRAAMDWSHDLLPEPERILFRRMSVFAGGCSLDAVEAVCDAAQAADTVDLLAQLVSKSLVLVNPATARYRMLETVREYAREHAAATGDDAQVRPRHRDFYLAMAERAEPELRGPDQQTWLARLETDHDNLRAALQWSHSSAEADALLRLAGALWRFWYVRGYWHEGQQWLEQALVLDRDATPRAVRAKAAFAAGVLAWFRDEFERAGRWLEESRRLAERLGDRALAADALRHLAMLAGGREDHDEARRLAEISLRLFEELDDKWGVAAVSRLLGFQAAGYVGFRRSDRVDLDLAARLLDRSLTLAREIDDRRGMAWSLDGLGSVLWNEGNRQQAEATYAEALVLFREVGDRMGIAQGLRRLALASARRGELAHARTLADEGLALAEELGVPFILADLSLGKAELALGVGDVTEAEAHGRRALQLEHRINDRPGMADCVDILARGAAARRRWRRAATLLEAAAALRASSRTVLPTLEQEELDRLSATVRAALGESAYTRVLEAAGVMEAHEIVSFALDDSPQPGPPAGSPVPAEDPLTEREREVAALVARGSTNREIAGTLFLSERTVESHVQHILNKLGFRSRVQIAAWAVATRLE